MALLLGIAFLTAAVLVLRRALLRTDAPVGLARSLAALEQMSSAPAELTQEAERPFGERVLQPLQGRALSVGRRIIGADKAEILRKKLDHAGNPAGLTVDRVVSLKVIGAVALPVVTALYALLAGLSPLWSVVAVVAMTLFGFFGVDLWIYNTTQKRNARIGRDLADAVDLLTISVEAGLAFDAALQQVAMKTEGPLASEFSRVLREMQIGQGRSGALRALSDRTSVADLKSFVSAMVQADSFGIPIGQVLRVQSSEMRVKRRQAAEAKAQQVPVKMTIPLVIFILPTLFVVILGPAALSAMKAF